MFRRANFVLSRTILHQSPQPLVPISQHLAFWHRSHLAASRTDLCHTISYRSCSISCYRLAPCLAPIPAASRTNLAAFGTDLAASCATVPISHDLVQTFHHLDRSRGTISYRSCSSTILQHFYRQVAEQASAVIAAATATAAASVGSLAGAAVACGDGCKLCFLAPRNMKLKTTPCVLACMYQHTLAVVGAPQPMGPQPWGNCTSTAHCLFCFAIGHQIH